MSKIVDFNKEKSKVLQRKQEEAKRKIQNEKVIKKFKRDEKHPKFKVWMFYGCLLIAIAIFIVLFK